MESFQDFIDNKKGNTLDKVLNEILNSTCSKNLSSNNLIPCYEEGKIATAYFSPGGFSKISNVLKNIKNLKLMLGTEPLSDIEKWNRKVGDSEDKFILKKFKENLEKQEYNLRQERNHLPFSKDSSSKIKQLIDLLRNGGMEVRRYEKNFLHAKAYIFSESNPNENSKNKAVIVGSSNLTSSGLTSNLELNIGKYDNSTLLKASKWFDELWEEAMPFDLASYFEEIFVPQKPFDIFLRVLFELYGKEIDQEFSEEKIINTTTFQKHGAARAKRLIDETGGVIVADEVGLGKTFIAAEILMSYQERRQKAMLICPAALRDSTWKKFKSEYQIHLDTYSFEEIAQDEQLHDEELRPNSNSKNIELPIDDYQLIIIDEAHNYRNPDSPFRAKALEALLYGKRKDVLMLTATPVNNSLWDLYNLTYFFLKVDSYLANKGILSIKDRFQMAMRTDPRNLSPDILYPIIDATTVKRTRQFIKKHYSNDVIKVDGKPKTIVFPKPIAISVRYKLSNLLPGVFDLIENYLDPDNSDSITFTRYKTDLYLIDSLQEDDHLTNAISGLLLSGLLKRFESSTGAFRESIKKLISQHELFLKALDKGFVLSTEFIKDAIGCDDDEFDELLEERDDSMPASNYKKDILRTEVLKDLNKLREIFNLIENISPENDPKLKVLVKELKFILKEARETSSSLEEEIDRRKVIIFSYYSDTVKWIQDYLNEAINQEEDLFPYKERIEIVIGTKTKDISDKNNVASKFAPKTAGKKGDKNLTDILISTDVLAEGVNLQQARHIINYDMPWNPMRLVQRHGRIDRIGSEHNKVFMRTIFPADRLDALLGLEERISRKIAMAAASVGVISPISGVNSGNINFSETREEIQKLIDEDASIYERGGTIYGVQSGEEYRQTLRKELSFRRENISDMPWKVGSGMKKGKEQGIFFCAKVGDQRTYLRFIHTDKNWKPKMIKDDDLEDQEMPLFDSELGKCLRLIECEEDTTLHLDNSAKDAVYDLWQITRDNIFESWNFETDPKNLQPKIRLLNRKVAEFLMENRPSNIENNTFERALEILESPWARRRNEKKLRIWFETNLEGTRKSEFIIKKIIQSGIEPFKSPEPLPPINKDEIELLVWMAIVKE